MPCLVAIVTVHMYKVQCIPYLVVTASSFKDLVKVTQENSTNQTAGVLVEKELQPLQDIATVEQEQELHKPKSIAEQGSYFCL